MFGQNTRELGWSVKAGMTPEQALRTATVNAAELLGKEKELGPLRRDISPIWSQWMAIPWWTSMWS